MRCLDCALASAAFVALCLVASGALAQTPGDFSTLSTTGTASLGGDVLACSGRPWIDVRCNGAVGDDSHDDTSAIQETIATAIAKGWPVNFPAGTYKITTPLTIDYAGLASSGFRLVSEGASLDARSITSTPVLQVDCSGGTPATPANCFYFHEEGTFSIFADTDAYAVVIGKTDFSDAQNSLKIDHLIVNNASTGSAAGGLQLNYVLDSDIVAIADSAGGAAGVALEQTQFTRLSGAGSASGAGGASLLLENGYNFSNTIFAFDMEVSPTCLAITFPHNGLNTFVSPYFDCTTAVDATASTGNVLINPNYGGGVVNRGPQSTGISVIGTGSFSAWNFPAVASYTATPIDDGTAISSYSATDSSLAVTLPAPGTAGAGWTMGFATDNGKGLTVTTPSGKILGGGKAAATLTLGAGDYEYVELQSDGSNFRVVAATRNTLTQNGMVSRDWPGNWLYPSSPGYAATLADNGNVLSSFDTPSGLAVTLPSTVGLPDGWSMGFATDSGKGVTITVDGSGGGHILWPGSGGAATSLSLADTSQGAYEFLVLQYDGGGDFRVEDATPATAQAIGVIGAGGLSHWSFPAASAYQATQADNGNVVSSDNSPLSYMTATLPSVGSISMGWTIGLATDGGKTMSVQVNGTGGGHILYPGSAATTNSATLAPGSYEFLALQFDGDNFRVVQATPATAAAIGMTDAAVGPRWSFPASSTYGASAGDNGNTVSSFNSPGGSLTVSLPTTGAITAGWTMGFASDNGNALTIDVNGTSGGNILVPGTLGAASSLVLAPGNYEHLELQFDGSNFRVVQATPATASALGMSPATGTPASSAAACQTGRLEADSNYLYFCTGPNTWKRAAWSSF